MRRATISAAVPEAATVAAALEPDDTDEIDTRIADGTLVATIERPSTSGLRSTVDDYLVNLDVAVRVMTEAGDDRDPGIESAIDANTDRDGDTDADTDGDTDAESHTRANTNANTTTNTTTNTNTNTTSDSQ